MNLYSKKTISFFRSFTSSFAWIPFSPLWVVVKSFRRFIALSARRIIFSDFSESGESLFLARFFQELDYNSIPYPKVFVDVGVNDGVRGSNSRNWILSGWKAVLVDPNPTCVSHVSRLYRSFEDVVISECALSDSSESGFLRRNTGHIFDGSASLVSDSSSMSGDFDFLDVDIKVTSDLLESISFCDDGIGIMSIDTEGNDLAVLRGLGSYLPLVIVTERGVPGIENLAAKQLYLQGLGYLLILRTYSNDIYILSDYARRCRLIPL